MALTNVYLHGRLGKLYGREWRLDVRSPAEAIRAIDVNLKGLLRDYLSKEGAKKFYKVCLGNLDNALDKSELAINSGQVDIHIVPVPKGRKSGVGKIIAGIALIVTAIYAPQLMTSVANFIGNGVTASQVATAFVTIGASLTLGGVVQMLTPVPNFNNDADGDGRGSSLFQGNSVVTTQGSTVGLVYGRMMVTPMPVSVAFDNYDQAASANNFTIGGYETRYNAETGLLEQVPLGTEG